MDVATLISKLYPLLDDPVANSSTMTEEQKVTVSVGTAPDIRRVARSRTATHRTVISP